jgi:peptidoglycan/xylan/chitin deacetylase (PgdA/CDA1 family)
MRMPYDEFNPTSLQVLGNLGYRVISWNIDSYDWNLNDPTQEMARITPVVDASSPTRDSFLQLDHDTKTSTQAFAERLIPYIKGRGYRLVTVAECLNDPQPYKP